MIYKPDFDKFRFLTHFWFLSHGENSFTDVSPGSAFWYKKEETRKKRFIRFSVLEGRRRESEETYNIFSCVI